MRHYRRLFLAINIIVLCGLEADGASKYYDGENKPYEFGFNIEGEQHRHEKKDENGLIMGEFGFITADGVYHVTVYATDENGNFKIVSMKNIRVKPYPSGPNTAKKAASPERKGNSLPFPPANAQPAPQANAQPVPRANAVAQRPKPAQPQKPLPVASPAKSCSHCSLPTTTTQRPSIPDIPANIYNTPGNGPIPANNYNSPSNDPRPANNYKSPGNGPIPANNYNSPKNSPSPANNYNTPRNGPQSQVNRVEQNYNNREGGFPKTQPSVGRSQPVAPSLAGQPNYNPPGLGRGVPPQSGLAQGGSAESYPKQAAQYPNPNTAPGSGAGARNPKQYGNAQSNAARDEPYNPQGGPSGTLTSPLSPDKPILVSANMQRADKNIDINRRGPGEREGLPDKLDKNDMMLLLYTFNYTVGFHGHHEEGYTNGAKKGYYYVTGRNGIRTRVDYTADETGFHPKITQEVFDTLSEEVPKEETEKDAKYGLKGYEFKWIYYPVDSKSR